MSSNLTFNTLVESQQIMSANDGVGVQGLALPFEKTSRNGFKYITESIKQAFQSMIGQPVLFNHDPDKVIGHVQNIDLSEEGMTYQMNLDTDGPFGWVANKVRRGDLKKVSIQCLYDEEKSYLEEDGTMNAWVKEFLELSVVTIPGFADTTAQVYEQFKAKNSQGETKMSEEEQAKKDAVVEPSEPQEQPKPVEEQPAEAEKPKQEDSQTEAVDDNEDEEDKDKASEEDDRLSKLEKEVANLKSMMKDMDKKKESDDEKGDDEEDKDKKVEEAIRNDKLSVSSESMQEEPISLSREDLTSLYGKFV